VHSGRYSDEEVMSFVGLGYPGKREDVARRKLILREDTHQGEENVT